MKRNEAGDGTGGGSPGDPIARGDSRTRRRVIIQALYELMLSQGYAETSLSQLAARAGMSVSHLLYYFPSKEAILIQLGDGIVQRVLSTVFPEMPDSPQAKIEMLVETRFVDRTESWIWKEIKALAYHRPELRRLLESTFEARHDHLRALFAATPRQPGVSVEDAAEMAGAIWEGLLDSFLLARLSDVEARRLFRLQLYWLAGLDSKAL